MLVGSRNVGTEMSCRESHGYHNTRRDGCPDLPGSFRSEGTRWNVEHHSNTYTYAER